VLDTAQLDAGKVEWDFKRLSAHHLLERAMSATATMAAQKNLDLSCQADPELPEFTGDEDRLLKVLVNLISNAIKFTTEGQIVLRAERLDRHIRFAVEDSGIGIAPSDQQAVFEKFCQIGDTLTDKPKGSGLGLSICQQIVEHHGGRIWLESVPGQGSTFYFTVPIA
jgi:signal transduction histidine kinase